MRQSIRVIELGGGVAGDGEEVGAVHVQTIDGRRLVDTVAPDAPQIVIGADPTTLGGWPGNLTDELARVGDGRQ